MGVNARRLRMAVMVAATLLTAASVSVSGMIGWVGLVIPHVARMLIGCDYRRLLPASMLLGASFPLIVVDNVARLATTADTPIGILTALRRRAVLPVPHHARKKQRMSIEDRAPLASRTARVDAMAQVRGQRP